MRLVFVNYCHPETPHVCGLRVARFAEAMAARGHRVVLVTRELDGLPAAPPAGALPDLLAGHDWTRPLHLAVAPGPGRFFKALQQGGLPAWLRRPAIAGAYLATGGLYGDWRRAALAYGPVLAGHFRPDLAWGTFGNTDTWAVARGLARAAGAPWVADIKDYWRVFIPCPLRRPLAGRFRDFRALTAFSASHAGEARPWFGDAAVVYSGIPAEFAQARPGEPAQPFVLAVTGSLYDGTQLESLAAVLGRWGEGRNGRPRLVYAGADHRRMERAAARLTGWEVAIHPYLPLDRLRRLTLTASANLYIRSDRTFHHKVLELLSAGRPVISFPAEGAEAHDLARACGGTLLSCGSEAELLAALDRVASGEQLPAATPDRLAAFTWAGQAGALEAVFARVLEGRA